MRILVLGANGQVGQAIRALSASYPQWDFTFAGKEDIDLENGDITDKIISYHANILINCAAYTKVDLAETEVLRCWKINAHSVARIAKACAAAGTAFIHISTDYVYDQNRGLPYRESDPASPKSMYAVSKLSGEILARAFLPDTIIVRTSWVYSHTGQNFVKTMLRLAEAGKTIRVVNDQFGAPTSAGDLAAALIKIVSSIESQGVRKVSGVYNFANEGITTWYDFAKTIFEYRGLSTEVLPISTAEFGAAAPRPAWSVMSMAKFKDTFQYSIPHWKQSLHAVLDELSRHTV